MAFGNHTLAKVGLVTAYAAVAALAATFYGALQSDGHEHVATHAHGHAAATSARSHPDAAILVAAAGVGIVALTWVLLPESRRRRLPAELALCSAAAATIHFAVVSPHWDEYVPFAVLFALVGAFQLVWAAAVLASPASVVLLAGAVVNLGVAGAWALSRTAGLPIGPDAWTPEPVGAADVVATVFELAIAAGSAVLLSSAASRLETRTPRAAAQMAAIAIGVTLLFALILL